MSKHPGKQKLDELVALAEANSGFSNWWINVSFADIRSISDAYKALEERAEKAEAALAIARPAILEEAAAHLIALSDAMWEKTDHVAPEAFEPPTAEERDSAVMAYDFQKAAECIRALATTGQEGGR